MPSKVCEGGGESGGESGSLHVDINFPNLKFAIVELISNWKLKEFAGAVWIVTRTDFLTVGIGV